MSLKESSVVKVKTYKVSPRHSSANLTIVSTGDWHISPLITSLQSEILQDKLPLIRPDVIILQGDLMDSPDYLESSQLVDVLLRQLKICSKIAPTVMVLGNHDFIRPTHKKDPSFEIFQTRIPKGIIETWRQICREAKVKLLLDEWFEVKKLRIFGFFESSRVYFRDDGEKGENLSEIKRRLLELNSEGLLARSVFERHPDSAFLFASHSPVGNLVELPELRRFDFLTFGHMHGGVVPLLMDDLFDAVGYHGGLYAPFNRFFPKTQARGLETLLDGRKLLVNSGLVLGQASAPKFFQNLNFLKAAELSVLSISKDSPQKNP